MQYIWLGAIGFLVLYSFDLLALRRIPYAKQIVGLAAMGMIGYAHLMVSLRGPKLPLPADLAYVGWPLFVLGSLALFYSLFFEIPFRATYLKEGVGEQLVTTGTYALTRHPGVLWYALLLVAQILISRSRWAVYAAPIWLLMDVLWVWIQERFFFSRMFSGYESYKQETPMLIPNRQSIAKCVASFRTPLHRARQDDGTAQGRVQKRRIGTCAEDEKG